MRVRITDSAEFDLEEIGGFIAADSPIRAETFVREIVDHCLDLATHAQRYPVCICAGSGDETLPSWALLDLLLD